MNLATLLIKLQQLKWGSWSLVCLYISLGSGIIVGLQYDPDTPFFSVTSLDLLVPFGEYFRSLHFYSSQLFLLFAIVHLIAVFHETDKLKSSSWAMLILGLPVSLLLLFTGYVLRGDNTGYSAGMIAESILLTIPLFGNFLNTLLFDISASGMKRVYIHHVITFDLLWLILCWEHLRKYRVRVRDQVGIIAITLIFCLLVTAPLEPEKAGTTYISGPWFFLGLQELLRYFPPLFAGVILPLLFMVVLLYCRKNSKHLNLALIFITCWLFLYTIFTTIAWLR